MADHNPLSLGAPIVSPSSSMANLPQTADSQPSASVISPSTRHVPEPTFSTRGVSDLSASHGLGPQPNNGAPSSRPTGYVPPNPPPLEHVRSAPTTMLPTLAVAHQGGGDGGEPAVGQHVNERANLAPSDSEESSTPTLHGQSSDHQGRGMPEHVDVPLSVGGLHGQPMPGSHQAMTHGDLNEKDHQAATVGGKTGPEVAALAQKELGINGEGDITDEKLAAKAHAAVTADPLQGSGRKIERTNTGTNVTRHQATSGGQTTVQAMGMVPVTRQFSQPPAVSPFGGVSPSGIDAEEGLSPVRSHEEEEEREELRKAKGPDPWAVKFEPGEKINPKVNSGAGYAGRSTADNMRRTGASCIDGTSLALLVS